MNVCVNLFPILDCITNTVQYFKYGRPCSNVTTEKEKEIADDYVSNNI